MLFTSKKIILSGVGFEPTNRLGLDLETNCFDRLHTLTLGGNYTVFRMLYKCGITCEIYPLMITFQYKLCNSKMFFGNLVIAQEVYCSREFVGRDDNF